MNNDHPHNLRSACAEISIEGPSLWLMTFEVANSDDHPNELTDLLLIASTRAIDEALKLDIEID